MMVTPTPQPEPSPEPVKEEEPEPEEPLRSAEELETLMNFLSVQIYKTLKAYPLYDVPKILREESQKSDLTLFKLKLHDFTFNLKKISQHEFEKISGGRL